MPANYKTTLYLDRVVLKVTQATEEVVSALVLQGEALVKVNIQANDQIDTGFLLNSTYAVTRRMSEYGMARSAATTFRQSVKQNRTLSSREARGRLAPKLALGSSSKQVLGAIVIGAKYAIYQELRRAFAYPALVSLARQAGGIAQPIYRRVVRD